MNSERLNEHDANQGAQSQGEFLGMTGNSAWYLLGAAGGTVLLTILFWGVLGFPLLACLGAGAVLCSLALAYVFALKNNRPEHYDSDFIESALVESGLVALRFGPREKCPHNPFQPTIVASSVEPAPPPVTVVAHNRRRPIVSLARPNTATLRPDPAPRKRPRDETVPSVPLADYERLRAELNETEEALAEAIATGEEGEP